ncbi:MAG TPA: D-glycerate dehydrogenase [Longimicrobiales bacterium]|nr:D-glycerate dehydrogenase [Longimicrobiales bacterium]
MSLRIVVTRRIPDRGLRILRDSGASVHILQQDPRASVDRNALLDAVAEADVLVSLLTERIDDPLLARATRLRGIANFAVGFNNIDVDAATRLGIPVSNTPGVLTEATADLTWALLLAIARRIPEAHNYMVAGEYRIWGPELLLGEDVGRGADGERRTLGIIGFGRIGQAVARRARGFDMRVVAFDPYMRDAIGASHDAEWSDFDSLLQQSDFVSLHALLTDETHHLIGERELRLMKNRAFLINVARGEMVDEAVLVRALGEGWIAGAALDVYEREPAMADGLAQCANAVFVPHIGSATHGTRNRMATMAADNAVAHLNLQQAPHPVNHAVYDTPAYRDRLARLAV